MRGRLLTSSLTALPALCPPPPPPPPPPPLPAAPPQRRAWFRYSKEMSKIAVKMSRWVQRLQQYTVSPVEAMASTARHSMEVRMQGGQGPGAAPRSCGLRRRRVVALQAQKGHRGGTIRV